MEAIIQDGLPKGSYEFQFTLKNGKRPDCVVLLPNQRPLVIDAKFPLEAVTAFRDGKCEDERKVAAQRVRQDVSKHINDIAERYLCPGETQDTALMFVPSESVYAELHDGFDDIVQKAYRAQVMRLPSTSGDSSGIASVITVAIAATAANSMAKNLVSYMRAMMRSSTMDLRSRN